MLLRRLKSLRPRCPQQHTCTSIMIVATACSSVNAQSWADSVAKRTDYAPLSGLCRPRRKCLCLCRMLSLHVSCNVPSSCSRVHCTHINIARDKTHTHGEQQLTQGERKGAEGLAGWRGDTEHSLHPTTGQEKGRSPVCLRMCAVRCVDCADAYEQLSHGHLNGFSPVCVRIWRFRWPVPLAA